MLFKKTFLLLNFVVVCSVLNQSAMAEPLSVYGRANVSLQYTDEGEGGFSELSSNASRFGLKGDTSLENGLTALYKIEWQIDLTGSSASDNIKPREQYLGLRGGFGTVLLGRVDSYTKSYHSKLDMFNDYQGDIKGLWKGENRFNQTLSYESMAVNGFHFAINYVTQGTAEEQDGVSMGLRYGDAKLKKSSWNAALTMDQDIKGYDTQRASFQTKQGSWLFGAMLHRQTQSTTNLSGNGVLLSAQYSYNDWKLKTQLQTLDDDRSISVGADYALGQSTKGFIWFTQHTFDERDDKSWLAVGLEHRFEQ